MPAREFVWRDFAGFAKIQVFGVVREMIIKSTRSLLGYLLKTNISIKNAEFFTMILRTIDGPLKIDPSSF